MIKGIQHSKITKEKMNKIAKNIWKDDEIKNEKMKDNGFRVIRIWEKDINRMIIKEFENKLKEININLK